MAYSPRLTDILLKEELEAFGAVLLIGPKFCGKTTTASQIAKSIRFMQDPNEQDTYLQIAELTPSFLLEGENPLLIDEWQMAPQLWDAVRHSVDLRGEFGLYILTGSVTVDETKIKHSGIGRISRLRMYTMSLFESNDSNGTVSIAQLFENPGTALSARSSLRVEDYAHLIVRGGWPNMVGLHEKVVARQIAGYCDLLTKSEIMTVDGVTRDPRKVELFLRSFARHTATQASKATILEDMKHIDKNIHINTLQSYFTAFENLFIIDNLPAWSPRLRSKTTIRFADTLHFTDPAIAAHLLKAFPRDLLFDPHTFGLLFESLVVRDLRIYAQALRGHVSHYRDRNGLEADAIIHLPTGEWAAIEVKLSLYHVDEAAENLLSLKDKIDTDHMHSPAFLMVVTASEYAYRRNDGVYVVPLGCLRP